MDSLSPIQNQHEAQNRQMQRNDQWPHRNKNNKRSSSFDPLLSRSRRGLSFLLSSLSLALSLGAGGGLIFGLIGCDPTPDHSTSISNRGRGTTGAAWGPSTTTSSLGSAQAAAALNFRQATGNIFQSSTSYASSFMALLRGFVSPTINPTSLGDVDPSQGVTFTGYAEADPRTGQIVPGANMGISIIIRDSYAYSSYSGTYSTDSGGGPVVINLPLTQGALYPSTTQGTARLHFEDQYGMVELQGTYSNSNYNGGSVFAGTLTFQNRNASSGYGTSYPTQGSFDFRINTCGFLLCYQY